MDELIYAMNECYRYTSGRVISVDVKRSEMFSSSQC